MTKSEPPIPRQARAPRALFAGVLSDAFVALCVFALLLAGCSPSTTSGQSGRPAATSGALSPTALAMTPGGETLYIACATANAVLAFDTARQQIVRRFELPATPSGLVLSADGRRLVVTCAGPSSPVCIVDTVSGKVLKSLAAHHTALGPVLASDEKTLFVCNRFNNDVSLFDLRDGRELCRIPVAREPVSAALARDGRFLLVANHLPRGRSDVPYVAATVSVIDVAARKVVKELHLPNGTINLREVRVSPDGKYACVAHTVGRFQVPVTQLHRGWVNTSALTLIDLSTLDVLNTVLLDDADRGAANPWALAWTADGRWLCVSHAGTHELSLIDFPALLKKLSSLPPNVPPDSTKGGDVSSRCQADVMNDLSFLVGVRQRLKLQGNGPRALVIDRNRAYAAGYFSDSLEVVALSSLPVKPDIALNPGSALTHISLNTAYSPSVQRRGEMYFNDATLCFQGWQSCATCHDDDARVDGLNWDLLNDGIGNPKDTKSLVLAHQTPPVMSLGVRATAEVAVRNGIHNSLASALPEEVAAAMDEWLKSIQPAPSPYLVGGRLSPLAREGEKIFHDSAAGCAICHEPSLFTDLRSYPVGTENPFDHEDKSFDTPTLHELWRTAPYLHDGSAATIREVLTTRNPKDAHGSTSQLTARQIDALVEYVLSL